MSYDTYQEAVDDAVGPRFRPTYTVVTYQAVEAVTLQNSDDKILMETKI